MANLSISLLVSNVRCSCHFYTLAFFVVLSHSCIIFLTFFRVLIVASTLKSSQLKTTVLANLTVKTKCFFLCAGEWVSRRIRTGLCARDTYFPALALFPRSLIRNALLPFYAQKGVGAYSISFWRLNDLINASFPVCCM